MASRCGIASKWMITGSLIRIPRNNLAKSAHPAIGNIGRRCFYNFAPLGSCCSSLDGQNLHQKPKKPTFHSSVQKISSSSFSYFPFALGGIGGLKLTPGKYSRLGGAANFSTSTVFFNSADVNHDTIIKPKSNIEEFVVPDAPGVPDGAGEIGEMILTAPSSSLAELGLNTWYPSGLLRSTLDFIHVTLDIPWWGAIVIATLIARICLFPLVIKSQKNAAAMQKNMPEFQRLQMKMSDARQRGDIMASAQAGQELQEFMKAGGINPLKSMIPALVQAPVFMSFFFGLRGMANAPVESFKEGGLWWFTDLTLADPYYALPILTSVTLLAVIELGVDSGGIQPQQMVYMKWFLRGLPFLTLFFTSGFPSALLLYWFTSNFISLIQAGILRIPSIRAKFNIPPIVRHKPEDLPMKKKSLKESFRESMQNNRIARELDERTKLDVVNFRQAGMGPVPKTYRKDPTKIAPAATSSVPGRKADNKAKN